MNTAKSFPAKYPGTCALCGSPFAAGTLIAYNGQAFEVVCVEQAKADDARRDAEESAFQTKAMAEFKAGLRIRAIPGPKELMIEGAPNYEMARAEAFAVAASITAAGGKAKILSHKGRDGKRHVGRTVVRYYGMSNLAHHEGWAFKWACETA